MEALVTRARFALLLNASACFLFAPQFANFAVAASHRTENFIVTAATKELAAEIANAAERYRVELAVEWLGKELPRWSDPCPIRAKVGPQLGAGGATSFLFETYEHQYARPVSHRTGDGLFQSKPVGRPFGWEMTIQGTRQRVLDSVLPHEVTHTIFATHFGRPLPRWADEGACTTVEHVSEKAKQHRMLYEFLTSDRGIAFNRMFSMTEYPADILPLYSQGFSLARFLIAQGGKQKFVKYIEDGLNSNDWTQSTQRHYGFASLSELQVTWLDWVRAGSPAIPNRKKASEFELPSRMIADRGNIHPVQQVNASQRQRLAANASHAARTNSASPGQSWYVSRSRQARDGELGEAKQLATVKGQQDSKWVSDTRVASRPNKSQFDREVLFEWGQASPFLTPQLADRRAQQLR